MRAIFLEIWEAIMTALRAIGVHKMRSILTTLGIIIGIASVTSMATVINGIEQQFEASMSNLGTDVMYVEKWPWTGGPGTKWWEYRNRPEIKAELADIITERARMVTAAVPVVSTNRPVSYESNTIVNVNVEASTSAYVQVHAIDIESGRFYSDIDDRTARNVAVIGAEIAENLFRNQNPLGKYIRIGGDRFQVIGVLERKGSGSDDQSSADRQTRIPFNTFKKLYGVQNRGISVQARVEPGIPLALAKDEITGILRVARGVDARDDNDFEINEHESLRADMAPIKTAIYGIGIFLTALALLVGGIGVMNIMFVSVKERTKEIGLRKAIGARRRTILMQFLTEAVVVCLIGGLIGVAFAAGIAALINVFFTAYLPIGTVIIAFAICVAVGVIFGLAPAWAAAKSDPMESLRYE